LLHSEWNCGLLRSPERFLTGKAGSRARVFRLREHPHLCRKTRGKDGNPRFAPKIRTEIENNLAQTATAPQRSTPSVTPVADLARFFPEATPVRIPVHLARIHAPGGAAEFSESTVIEFGTPHEVLFAAKAPLEFADVLRLRNSDGTFDTEVSVVAVQYHPGNTLVAARFVSDVPNWIVKS